MDGRALHAFGELRLTPAKQLRESRRIEAVTDLEVRVGGTLREFIPRTHELTVIAPIDAIAERRTQRLGYGALELDGQIGNAAARIKLVRGDDGPGRAGRNAGAAAAAMGAARRIDRQRQVGIDLA